MTFQMIKWQVEEWIRDYNFMLREIARLNRILSSLGGSQKLTATYGIDSVLPKGSGGISQAELNQLDHREKRLYKYETIINYLDNGMDALEDEKQKVVYDCMMEGMSYTAIAIHIGCSRDTIREVKEGIIANIAKKVEKDQFLQKLNSIKKAM